jgi:hypothetical protein
LAQTLTRAGTCTAVPGPLGKTELSPGMKCLLPDGVTTGYVTFVDAYLSDQRIDVSQTLMRVATCTAVAGPFAKTELASPAGRCLQSDGVTLGYVTFVDAYVSNQPITAGGPVAGGSNVSSDIFVGAVLVLCFAVGWIAGGQR